MLAQTVVFWYCTFLKTITHVWEVLECTLCIWWKLYSLKQLHLYGGPCLVSISSMPLWLLLVQQHLDAKPHLLLFGWLSGIGCTALTKCKAPTQDAHESYYTPSTESDEQAGKSPVPDFGGSLISVTRGMDAHEGSFWRFCMIVMV